MGATFDQTKLMERVDNDVEFLAETIHILTTEGTELMAGVRAAASSSDTGALARSAHALRGMVSNFCAPDVYAAALEVEQIGKRGDLASAAPAVERLGQCLEALAADLHRFLAESRA